MGEFVRFDVIEQVTFFDSLEEFLPRYPRIFELFNHDVICFYKHLYWRARMQVFYDLQSHRLILFRAVGGLSNTY